MTDNHRIRDSFARQSMMHTLGAEITAISNGAVVITAPIRDDVKQQHDFAHAALAFAVGDSAAGYAALTMLDAEHEVVTAEMKINLLAPATGDRLVAEGRVEKAGRRLVVVAADVYAETGDARKRIAMLQGTIIPIPV
jgi:uncharacterized protein (TIGR00369 family)